MFDNNDDEVLGPGTDLAFSLGGIFIIVTIILALLLLLFSRDTQHRVGQMGADAETRISKLLRRISELEGEVGAQVSLVVKVKADSASLQKRLGSTQAKLEEEERLSDSLRTNLAALQSNLDTAQAKLGEKEELSRKLQISLVSTQNSMEAARREREKVSSDFNSVAAELQALKVLYSARTSELQSLQRDLDNARAAPITPNDKPPLIKMADKKNYSLFEVGSAEPSVNLLELLNSKKDDLILNGKKYSTNVIEVIGYTDEIPIGEDSQSKKNLDKELLNVLNGRTPAKSLGVCDNVGLGMARAASVVNALRDLGLSQHFTILPLSGGQAVLPNDKLAAGRMEVFGEPYRRRIEIRLRRAN